VLTPSQTKLANLHARYIHKTENEERRANMAPAMG